MPSRIIDYQAIEPATIEWRDGSPYSTQFNDLYYNISDGKAETKYVFIEHNHLEERFQSLAPSAHFTIAETGFGTGLNFFCSVETFFQHAPRTASLFFVSFEKYPLHINDIKRALSSWPEFTDIVNEFERVYPPSTPGLHTLTLANERITLLLFLGDVELGLAQMEFTADAWFLDGFAPARNASMWQRCIVEQVAQHSRLGTSFSTFTAAGAVRRQLTDSGFTVQKAKGFSHKREMLIGSYNKPSEPLVDAKYKPWYFSYSNKPSTKRLNTNIRNKTCAIIGAGLAGSSSAYHLAKAGLQVTLFDKNAAPAQETSGNHAGITYTSLSHKPNAQIRYYWNSYLTATRDIPKIYQAEYFKPTGALYLAKDARDHERYQKVQQSGFYNSSPPKPSETVTNTHSRLSASHVHFKTAKQLLSEFGIKNNHGGVWMPHASALKPQQLCQQFISQANIHTLFNTEINQLEYNNSHWQLTDSSERSHSFDYVVIANAHAAIKFSQTEFITIRTIRGQTTNINSADTNYDKPFAICKSSYITPDIDGKISTGASFNLHNQSTEILVKEHQDNLDLTSKMLPDLSTVLSNLEPSELSGHAGLRCQTIDYLPIVGPVPDIEAYQKDYANLAKGQVKKSYPKGQYLPNLYLHTALGSRGITHCFINAQLIKAHIFNEPLPLEKDILESLYPARFIIKKIKRGQ